MPIMVKLRVACVYTLVSAPDMNLIQLWQQWKNIIDKADIRKVVLMSKSMKQLTDKPGLVLTNAKPGKIPINSALSVVLIVSLYHVQ